MKTLLKCFVLVLCALPAFAEEPSGSKLQLKLIMQAGTVAPWRASAPAMASAPASAPLFPPVSINHKDIPGSCDLSAGTLCYDYHNGRSVYKPSRLLMPEISGMQRESLTVKRNKITFNYSFK